MKGRLTLFPPGRGTRLLRSFASLCGSLPLAAPTYVLGEADPSADPANPDQVYPIIRSDDGRMSHSENTGLEKLIATVENPPETSNNRQEELDAFTSSRFRDALAPRNVHLLTYRQLIAIQGLQSMRRPEG